MNKIDGVLIREYVKQQCLVHKSYFETVGKQIAIIKFESLNNINFEDRTRDEAARISAEQKIAIFNAMGITTNYEIVVPNIDPKIFHKKIIDINQNKNTLAAIIQYPIPRSLVQSIEYLSPQKDIDVIRRASNNLFTSCATAEGIANLIQSYVQPNSLVAVVGGYGFVGSGVINYLQENNTSYFVLDYGDDLTNVKNADIIVTATGVPGVINKNHLQPSHRLVIDAGFAPTQDGIKGDVDKSAYYIPQNITPVPGGIGPIEMAILAQRVVKMELGIEMPKWNYQRLQQEQRQRALLILPWVITLFEQQKIYHPELINLINNNWEILEGDFYNVAYNSKNQTFLLKRVSDNINLVKYNQSNNQMEIARGLTEDDITRWQEINNIFNLNIKFNDQELET